MSVDDQRHFLHSGNGDLHWELFARQMWGNRYHGSVSFTDIKDWKKFYIRTLEFWLNSFTISVGSIDRLHRDEIASVVEKTIEQIKKSNKKDQVHSRLIACLFRLIFALIGNQPSRAGSSKQRHSTSMKLNSFRTMNYSQTVGQKSQFIKNIVLKNCSLYGFKDHCDFYKEYENWTKSKGLSKTDISFLSWVEQHRKMKDLL